MKTVTFCGHSNLPADKIPVITRNLQNIIGNLISRGVDEFLLGGYGGFDDLCANVVKDLKKDYPHTKSILVIPYIDRVWNKELYDFSVFPPIESVPKRFAIVRRNEYMVQRADMVIAYVECGWGGAAKTLAYAKRKKKSIVNIAEFFDKNIDNHKKQCYTVQK